MAETVQSLGLGERPSVGGFWQDGFFPLTSSLAAPLSALPFHSVLRLEPLPALRAWAIFLQVLCILLVALAGRELATPRAGLLAAAFFALHPFAFEFGGRGFYHHFSALMLFFSWRLSLRQEKWSPILAGLAVAGAYWLWWCLPLFAVDQARRSGVKEAFKFSAIAGLTAAVFVAANFVPDPASAWWSVGNLRRSFGAGTPASLLEFAKAAVKVFLQFPFLAAGLVAIFFSRSWLPVALAIGCVLEPIRQRGGIVGLPYPFMLSLPFIYLGLGLAADRSKYWALLALALAFPVNLGWFEVLAVDAGRAREMASALKQMAPPGAKVLGLGNFNWLLRPELKAAEPAEQGAYEGRDSGFYVAPVPKSRFAFSCGLDEIDYVVTCRVHFIGMLGLPGMRDTFLRIEKEGWPLVFDNKSFKVFQSPRLGLPPSPAGSKIPVFQMPTQEFKP